MDDLIIFRCPYTGMNVQTDLPKQEIKEGEQRYETIACPACMRHGAKRTARHTQNLRWRGDGPSQLSRSLSMNRQQQEISDLELTTEELDGVSGGMRNNETQAWKAFMKGFDKGWLESGGSIVIVD
jgi:hypothetical protein